jgi:thiol-disulfide isomerase/thioredoxin
MQPVCPHIEGRNITMRTIIGVAILAAATVFAAHAGEELAIGAKGPGFNLKGTDGNMYALDAIRGEKGTAVVFTCNECPYAKAYEDRLIALAHTYRAKGIAFIAINPNDPAIVPGDSFDAMVQRAKDKQFPYPYVYDGTQEVAAAYGAKVTPHIFLLDAGGTLVYRGRVDDSVKEDEVKKRDLQAALDALVAGSTLQVAETKAFGCSVKWSKKKA